MAGPPLSERLGSLLQQRISRRQFLRAAGAIGGTVAADLLFSHPAVRLTSTAYADTLRPVPAPIVLKKGAPTTESTNQLEQLAVSPRLLLTGDVEIRGKTPVAALANGHAAVAVASAEYEKENADEVAIYITSPSSTATEPRVIQKIPILMEMDGKAIRSIGLAAHPDKNGLTVVAMENSSEAIHVQSTDLNGQLGKKFIIEVKSGVTRTNVKVQSVGQGDLVYWNELRRQGNIQTQTTGGVLVDRKTGDILGELKLGPEGKNDTAGVKLGQKNSSLPHLTGCQITRSTNGLVAIGIENLPNNGKQVWAVTLDTDLKPQARKLIGDGDNVSEVTYRDGKAIFVGVTPVNPLDSKLLSHSVCVDQYGNLTDAASRELARTEGWRIGPITAADGLTAFGSWDPGQTYVLRFTTADGQPTADISTFHGIYESPRLRGPQLTRLSGVQQYGLATSDTTGVQSFAAYRTITH